jgi:hypothetical protein
MGCSYAARNRSARGSLLHALRVAVRRRDVRRGITDGARRDMEVSDTSRTGTLTAAKRDDHVCTTFAFGTDSAYAKREHPRPPGHGHRHLRDSHLLTPRWMHSSRRSLTLEVTGSRLDELLPEDMDYTEDENGTPVLGKKTFDPVELEPLALTLRQLRDELKSEPPERREQHHRPRRDRGPRPDRVRGLPTDRDGDERARGRSG